MSDTQDYNNVRQVMAITDTPFKTYKKTILGKVFITVWDEFLRKPVGILMKGDPRKQDAGCFIDVWSEQEDIFFRRSNSVHLETGTIIPYTRKREIPRETIESADDDTLKTIIEKKFMALQADLKKLDSLPVLFRLLTLAEDGDKSEKITAAIKRRISEIQERDFAVSE